MKTFVKIMLVAIMVMAATGQALAQPKQDKSKHVDHEKFAEMQARHISDEMAFDDATTKRFVDTYVKCQKDIWAARPPRRHDDKPSNEPKTEEQIGKNIQQRFEHSQKILDIREKYYKEYSKFLSQKQIERVYQLEQKMMRRLDKHRGKGH